MEINSDEISEYVSAVVKGIKGLPEGFDLSGPIKFQIGLTNVSDKKGSLKVMIAGIGGSRSKEENTRIEFEVSDTLSVALRKITELQNMPLMKHLNEMELEKSREMWRTIHDIVLRELDKIKDVRSPS